MARDYGKVTHRFWTGETGKKIRSLGLEARVVATYLLTCSSSNMIGIYYLPIALLVHESGCPIEGASKTLQSLSEIGFSYYDESEEIVFIPQMARVQVGDELKSGDKQRSGIIAQLKEHKKSKFIADFVAIYKDAFHLPDDLISKPLRSPLLSPIGDPSKPESRDQGSENIEQRTETPSARDPSATGTEYGIRPKHATASAWFHSFSLAWCKSKSKLSYAHSSDSVARGRFDSTLDALDPGDVLEAWNRKEAIFAEFLETNDRKAQEVGYIFAFFVNNFSAYMIPKEKRTAKEQPRRKGFNGIPENWMEGIK
jgi:hypothetical protein